MGIPATHIRINIEHFLAAADGREVLLTKVLPLSGVAPRDHHYVVR